MADEPKKFGETPLGQPPAQAPGQPQAAPQFTVDTTGMSSAYANFCRVTGTPEELVLDFGLNTQMSPVAGGEPVKLTHRLVLNFFTSKRLLGALHMAVQQHENVYGVLEVDIQKRMRSAPRVGPRPGGGFGQP